jgi:hypothetical protein
MSLRKKSSTNKLYKCLFILPVVAVISGSQCPYSDSDPACRQ